MKTCPYCGSKVEIYIQDYYCGFCEMKIDRSEVQENSQRKNLLPESQPCPSYLEKSTPELLCLSTIDLLFLLKFARKERSDIYHKRYIFIQAMKKGLNEVSDSEQYTFTEYEYWTRKCFVLENIIRERIGYVPYKLTDSYINNLAYRMEQSAEKPMIIRQAQKI